LGRFIDGVLTLAWTTLWLKFFTSQSRVLTRRGEVPVDSEIASEQTYSVIFRGPDHRPSLRDRAERQAAVRLGSIASLAAVTVLSIGLWAGIWVAVSTVAAVWPQ
jgi:hypothetical protein